MQLPFLKNKKWPRIRKPLDEKSYGLSPDEQIEEYCIGELMESGYVRPDDLLLGLDVSPRGRAIDSEGKESGRISLIGSIRRGVEWESIGITELKKQAPAIARDILSKPVFRADESDGDPGESTDSLAA